MEINTIGGVIVLRINLKTVIECCKPYAGIVGLDCLRKCEAGMNDWASGLRPRDGRKIT